MCKSITGTLVFAIVLMVYGCSEDSTSPRGQTLSEQVAGEWECVGFYVEGAERPLVDNNIFWYFRGTGEFCSQYITAYGGYYTGSSGQVDDGGSVLTETNLHDEEIRWQLSLCASTDTLRAISVAPDTLLGYEWVLIQTGDGPDSSCF